MRALTLIRPWAWALFHGKPVENRPWPPPEAFIGETIAVHAGRKWDRDGAEFVYRRLGPVSHRPAARAEGIIGVATIDRVISGQPLLPGEPIPPTDPLRASPWFFGPYGWVLRDQRELATPVPCKGMLGLWTLPPEVEAEVRRQLETAGDRGGGEDLNNEGDPVCGDNVRSDPGVPQCG
jgi:hypothetical protein